MKSCFLARGRRFFQTMTPISRSFTSYDLFAICVLAMLTGHVGYFFFPDMPWLRVLDRILMPAFLVAAGYNVARRNGQTIWFAAFAIAGVAFLLTHTVVFPLNFLFTVIVMRLIVGRITEEMLKSPVHFWVTVAALTSIVLVSDQVLEYGSLALLCAVAGRLRQDEAGLPPGIVNVKLYFAFTYVIYIGSVFYYMEFNHLQMGFVAFGAAGVMALMYNFRQLLINAVHRRPHDVIERFCAFLGHKSLEIYAIHTVIYTLIAALVV